VLSTAELAQTPITPKDLEGDYNPKETAFVYDFEKSWAKFLKENPKFIPKGKREERMQELKEQVREVEMSKDSVELELQKQLTFLKRSRDALEDLFVNKLQEAVEKRREMHEELSKRLDTVAMADYLQNETLPWQNFLHQVELVSESKSESSSSSSSGQNSGLRRAKPSKRAMALTEQSSGDSSDVELRAYRIDHALLTTHIQMLHKDMERLEHTIASQEEAGKFLTEHNVWAILTKSNATKASTVTPSLATARTAKTSVSPS